MGGTGYRARSRGFFDSDTKRNTLTTPLWDYFNHRRISRIAAELSIDPTELPSFARVRGTAPLDALGAIDWAKIHASNASRAHYMYDGDISNAQGLYKYFADLIVLDLRNSKVWPFLVVWLF